MRSKLFQISWHADEHGRSQPINSVDHHPLYPILATASNDHNVNLWRITRKVAPKSEQPTSSSATSAAAAAGAAAAAAAPGTDVEFEFLFAITCHVKSVNAVRFSPNGACSTPQIGGMCSWASQQCMCNAQ